MGDDPIGHAPIGHAPIGHSHPRLVASSERPSDPAGAVGADSAHIGEGTGQTNEIWQFVEDTGLAETMTRDRLSELWRSGGGGVPSGRSDDVHWSILSDCAPRWTRWCAPAVPLAKAPRKSSLRMKFWNLSPVLTRLLFGSFPNVVCVREATLCMRITRVPM
jgi:hypothetical protein